MFSATTTYGLTLKHTETLYLTAMPAKVSSLVTCIEQQSLVHEPFEGKGSMLTKQQTNACLPYGYSIGRSLAAERLCYWKWMDCHRPLHHPGPSAAVQLPARRCSTRGFYEIRPAQDIPGEAQC